MTRRGLPALLAAALAAPAGAAGIGAPLPAFDATTVDGTAFSSAEAAAAHRVVVVLFLSTVCPYANAFAGHIRELEERYRPQGVLFVGVNSNQYESAGEIREHARANGHSFPLIRDERARIADLFGARRTPEAFVAVDGRLRYHGWVESKRRAPDLQRALEAVLAGRSVRRPSTNAFGCAIDRPRP